MITLIRTPLRISFLGGGTDIEAWYRENGGAVLGMAMDKYCYLMGRYTPDEYDYKSKLVYSRLETVFDNKDLSHPIVREWLKCMDFKEGLEIHYWADLPARKGLGSSSAFAVGFVCLLEELWGKPSSQEHYAYSANYLERYLLKEAGGWQDPILCALGGVNYIKFDSENPAGLAERLPLWDSKWVAEYVLLVDTGITRLAREISASYELQPTVLKRMVELADRGKYTLLEHDWQGFGDLLHENWTLKKQLSPKVSNLVIDSIYETAVYNGALGGKIMGAGGGGYMMFFACPDRHDDIEKALGMKVIKVGIDVEGVKRIRSL